jgi:hypothetical protein
MISGLHASSLEYLNLSDELWGSSVTMEPFQPDLENIIVALQSNRSLKTIGISDVVLAAIGESDQGRLFRSLGNLPTLQQMTVYRGAGSPKTFPTRVLADALFETSNGLTTLILSKFKIGSRSEVEQLARGLKARVGSLNTLMIEGIVLDVRDKTGFLDPILLALAHVPSELRLSCLEAAPSGVSVVSPMALGAFFAKEQTERPSYTFLSLNNLGLNDNHCEAMAQALARDDGRLINMNDPLLRPIGLDLECNLSIGQQGYEALLGLLKRRFDIGVIEVDDNNWKKTFGMVVYMNSGCNRGRFLENGVFSSKAMWVNFLAGLASTDRHDYEAKRLNAIWYTLRENPDLICT